MQFIGKFHKLDPALRKFLTIWAGQAVSLTGTAMTRFALLTWAYQQTGEATTTALLGFFSFSLYVLLSPIAGVFVDRWDRRTVMILADTGAGVMTLALLILHLNGNLMIWHLFAAEALAGAFEAFQVPAYYASMSILVRKDQLGRMNGLQSLGGSIAEVIAPFFAGALLALIGLSAVLVIDLLTFLAAMVTLTVVRIPRPVATDAGYEAAGQFGREMRFGFGYIFRRRGLLGLMGLFMLINLTASITYFSVLPAMILARTGGNEMALAGVQSTLGIAAILGGVLVSVWGGPKRRIHGVLFVTALSFLLGDMIMGTGQNQAQWMLGAFAASFFIPIIVASDRSIWQSKVPHDIQGRIFSVRGMFINGVKLPGYLVAGLMADHLFEPLMADGGAWVGAFGDLVGSGAGAGMGLMFVCTACIGTVICLGGYLFPALRNVEDDLPDYDAPDSNLPEPELVEAPAV